MLRLHHRDGPLWQKYATVAFALVACLSAAGQRTPPAGPGVLNAYALAYDCTNKHVFIFAGANATAVVNSTWILDGSQWRLLTTSSVPSPRVFAAMAYDSSRKRAILFGGSSMLFGDFNYDHTLLSDTWAWDGTNWRNLGVSGPPARMDAGVAYDEVRQHIVLFGGLASVSGKLIRLGDTWEWDGARWIQVNVKGPSPRWGAAMVYDAGRRRIVLFGGSVEKTGPSPETWEWDGTSWTLVDASAPRRSQVAMAYDRRLSRIVRFGGWDGKDRSGETWVFAGNTWKLLDVNGPSPRNHAFMVFDGHANRIILHGGHNWDFVFGDTWEFKENRWSLVSESPAERQIMNGH